ncbi:putative nuclease HARBI1 [Lucilia cuprina]|nr:putative nuclease HARBI1 [Lucilia cuprina]
MEAVYILLSSSDSSSDSDSELEIMFSDDERENHIKVDNFMDIANRYSENDFKKHFRLNKSTAQLIIGKIFVCTLLCIFLNFKFNFRQIFNVQVFQNKFQTNKGKRRIDAETEVYIFLWYISNTEPFRTVANLFGISIYGCWQVVKRMTTWLISVSHIFDKWPENLQQVSDDFQLVRGMSGVVGAIDGTDIKIKSPRSNKEDYFNRKHYYSVKMQAVVGPNKEFFDIYCGEPGSLHDSRMLRRSPLFHSLERCGLPNNFYIIGDSAYPCGKWIITACVLHNICIKQDDQFDFEINEDQNLEFFGQSDEQSAEAFDRRNQLMEELINRHLI